MLDGLENSLGRLVRIMNLRNQEHSSPYLIVSSRGKRMSASMSRLRWDEATERAKAVAREVGDEQLAVRIGQFQFSRYQTEGDL